MHVKLMTSSRIAHSYILENLWLALQHWMPAWVIHFMRCHVTTSGLARGKTKYCTVHWIKTLDGRPNNRLEKIHRQCRHPYSSGKEADDLSGDPNCIHDSKDDLRSYTIYASRNIPAALNGTTLITHWCTTNTVYTLILDAWWAKLAVWPVC